MRLDEIQACAADRRLNQLKASADAAKEQAKRMKAQADVTADGIDAQKERQKKSQLQRVAVTKMIRPHK